VTGGSLKKGGKNDRHRGRGPMYFDERYRFECVQTLENRPANWETEGKKKLAQRERRVCGAGEGTATACPTWPFPCQKINELDV